MRTGAGDALRIGAGDALRTGAGDTLRIGAGDVEAARVNEFRRCAINVPPKSGSAASSELRRCVINVAPCVIDVSGRSEARLAGHNTGSRMASWLSEPDLEWLRLVGHLVPARQDIVTAATADAASGRTERCTEFGVNCG